MKIRQLTTIRLAEFPNILWVQLHTDEGLVGLGETFMGAAAVEAYLHEWAAQKLIGSNPLDIEARNRELIGYLGWRGSGVETRGNSAIDIALWDLFGSVKVAKNFELRAGVTNLFNRSLPIVASSQLSARNLFSTGSCAIKGRAASAKI